MISKKNRCKTCSEGEYSLEKQSIYCKPCLSNAICLGGNQIEVKFGYWRSNKYSENIYFCEENYANCLF